jgi:hypothetical protein
METTKIIGNAYCLTRKTTGEPAYAKASADNTAHRSFNAGGPFCLTRKTTGEPSWLTERITMELEAPPIKEASSIEVPNCKGTLIRYKVNFSFIIVACCRFLMGLTERITMELEAPPIKEASSIEASSVVCL